MVEQLSKGFQKRQTAFKVKVKHIIESNYFREEGFLPNYLKYKNFNFSRVNLMGAIVSKSDGQDSINMVFDDGSGKINLRSFEAMSFPGINVGDIVTVIGRPREYNNEKFVLPEVVRKIDDLIWIKIREKELKLFFDNIESEVIENPQIAESKVKEENIKAQVVVEDVVESIDEGKKELNPIEQMVELIRKMDSGEGVEIEKIIAESGNDKAEKIINSLLIQGDLFETKPGRVKILE